MAKYALMQHQTDGVKFIEDNDGIAALLWEPGVGKTGATLAWIDRLADRKGEVRVLVVAPLTAADTWVLQGPLFMDSPIKARLMQGSTASILAKMRTADQWNTVPDAKIKRDHPGTRTKQAAGNRVTILSMSAGAVSTYCSTRVKTVQMLQAIRRYKPDVVVLDESHIAKAHNSNISKAMYVIGQLAPHRIILTGTVNPKDVLDCYGQWRFLAPWTFSDQYDEPFVKTPLTMTKAQAESIKPWSWTRFLARYAVTNSFEYNKVTDFINSDDLRKRVSERSNVVRKEDALDLPPVSDVDVHVTLNAGERRAYNDMRDQLVAEMADGSFLEAPNALAKMMKLRQTTAGFMKDTLTEEVHNIGDSKRKAMAEVTCATLAGESRVVVFAYFRSECAMLAEMIRKREPNTTVEVITGSTKAGDRLAIRERFGDVSRNPGRVVLVAQARTMSISVNELVTAQNAVFGSMSERREDWVQSRGRLDRNGQTGQHVTFWNVYVPGSIDEVMLDRHKDRGNLEKALLDHIQHSPRL